MIWGKYRFIQHKMHLNIENMAHRSSIKILIVSLVHFTIRFVFFFVCLFIFFFTNGIHGVTWLFIVAKAADQFF